MDNTSDEHPISNQHDSNEFYQWAPVPKPSKDFIYAQEIGDVVVNYQIYEACKDKINGSACHDLYVLCQTIRNLYDSRVEVQIIVNNGLLKCCSDDVYLSGSNVVFITNCSIFKYEPSKDKYFCYIYAWVMLHDADIQAVQIAKRQSVLPRAKLTDVKSLSSWSDDYNSIRSVSFDSIEDIIRGKEPYQISSDYLPHLNFNESLDFHDGYNHIQCNGHTAHDIAAICKYMYDDGSNAFELHIVLKDFTDIFTRAYAIQLLNDDTMISCNTAYAFGPGGDMGGNILLHSDDIAFVYSQD